MACTPDPLCGQTAGLLTPPPSPQVVSDYLTSYDDAALMMQAGNQPVVVYTYRMAFRRAAAPSPDAAAEAAAAALEGVPT